MKHGIKPLTQSASAGAPDESVQNRLTPILPPERLLPIAEVKSQVGFGSSYIYELIKEGQFPAPVKVGNASRWLQSEIQGWVSEQIQNILGAVRYAENEVGIISDFSSY